MRSGHSSTHPAHPLLRLCAPAPAAPAARGCAQRRGAGGAAPGRRCDRARDPHQPAPGGGCAGAAGDHGRRRGLSARADCSVGQRCGAGPAREVGRCQCAHPAHTARPPPPPVDILCVGPKPVQQRYSGVIRVQDVRATEIDKVPARLPCPMHMHLSGAGSRSHAFAGLLQLTHARPLPLPPSCRRSRSRPASAPGTWCAPRCCPWETRAPTTSPPPRTSWAWCTRRAWRVRRLGGPAGVVGAGVRAVQAGPALAQVQAALQRCCAAVGAAAAGLRASCQQPSGAYRCSPRPAPSLHPPGPPPPRAGVPMVPISWQEMQCPQTKAVENRKVAKLEQ